MTTKFTANPTLEERKQVAFPPNRSYAKLELPPEVMCEVCHTHRAKFLLKNSFLLSCFGYSYNCTRTVPEGTPCYGCGKLATRIQACGPVCGEGTGRIQCPVAAQRNNSQGVATRSIKFEDPNYRKQRKDKFEATMLERYGVTCAIDNPEFLKKSRATTMERHGVESGAKIPGVFDGARKRFQEANPGLTHWTQLESTQERRKETCKEIYGFESPMQSPEVIESRRLHNQTKYGVDHPMQLPEVQEAQYRTWVANQGGSPFGSPEYFSKYNVWEKYAVTSTQNYGFPRPFQNSEFYHKEVLPSMYRTHTMTLPSGKVASYQGYEHYAINHLLKSFTEDELLLAGELTFPYLDHKGKQRVYFPDLGIRTKQISIEVKSPFTLSTALANGSLLLKLATTQAHGWLPVVMVFDNKSTLLETLFLEDLVEPTT